MADNIADKFEARVEVAPERLALVEGDERMTFGELELCANRFATSWRDRDLRLRVHARRDPGREPWDHGDRRACAYSARPGLSMR
jgi:non-ribosomal peptide synthetase component F